MLYIKNNYILIYQFVYFFTKSVGIGKTFTLKDYYDYTINTCFDLTKIKALFMASTSKTAFIIDGLTIYLTLNIFVQQILSNLPNSLNRLTCQYE